MKEYALRVGQDYIEIYSPIIRFNALRAILALVPIKRIEIQQTDVRGAYLNDISEETIYTMQPDEREEGIE